MTTQRIVNVPKAHIMALAINATYEADQAAYRAALAADNGTD